MIDRSRRHITACRAWRRRGRDAIAATAPALPAREVGVRHRLHLLLAVPPDCDDHDSEVQQIATQLGVHTVYGRGAERPRHRLLAAGHDLLDAPALVWEHVVLHERMAPVYQGALSVTGRELAPKEWRPVSRAQVVVATEDLWAEVHLLEGAPVEAAISHRGRRLGSTLVDSRLLDPDEPTHAPVRDGVARLSLPAGVWNVAVEARGSGVVEAGALIVGRIELVEQHRRYHLVR